MFIHRKLCQCQLSHRDYILDRRQLCPNGILGKEVERREADNKPLCEKPMLVMLLTN
jgi:hypothetical protein